MTYLPLTSLRSFEAAARLGSFKAAAQELCVTQSAVSHQVRHLEDWLGAPLFARQGGRPQLLPHGQELCRAIGLGFDAIATACDKARLGDAPAPVVIAAIPSVAVCWLIPNLPGFHAAHPGYPLRIVYALHGQSIDFRGVDLAFTFAAKPPGLPGCVTEPFLPGIGAPVASPALAATLGPRPDPASLARAALLHDTDLSGWRNWFARAGAAIKDVPEGPVFEDFNLLRAAALSGQGLALCPLAMIGEDLAQGRLVRLSDTTSAEDHAYYLLSATQSDPRRAAMVTAFRDWALATAHAQPRP